MQSEIVTVAWNCFSDCNRKNTQLICSTVINGENETVFVSQLILDIDTIIIEVNEIPILVDL